jgi:hypothetical protein
MRVKAFVGLLVRAGRLGKLKVPPPDMPWVPSLDAPAASRGRVSVEGPARVRATEPPVSVYFFRSVAWGAVPDFEQTFFKPPIFALQPSLCLNSVSTSDVAPHDSHR